MAGAARTTIRTLSRQATSPFSNKLVQQAAASASEYQGAPRGQGNDWGVGGPIASPSSLPSAQGPWFDHVGSWLAQAVSLSPYSSISSPPSTTLATQPAAISTGLALVASKDQLSGGALHARLNELAAEVLSNIHVYSLQEVCAWCEVCRQLDFADLANDQAAMTDAVRQYLDGREHEVEPHQLAAVMHMIALNDQPLPENVEKEWVVCVMNALPALTPVDLLEVAEAANSLALTTRAPHMAACVARAAAACIPACSAELAVRLAAAALPSALPHSAPERAALLSSMCQHLAMNSDEYPHDVLHKALRLVAGMAAGQPALQQYVWGLQQLAMRERMVAARVPRASAIGCVGNVQ